MKLVCTQVQDRRTKFIHACWFSILIHGELFQTPCTGFFDFNIGTQINTGWILRFIQTLSWTKTCSRLKTQQSLHKYVNILNNVLLVIRLYTPNYMHFNHLSQLPQIHGHQYQNPVEVNPLQDRLNLNSVEYTVCETQPYLD